MSHILFEKQNAVLISALVTADHRAEGLCS